MEKNNLQSFKQLVAEFSKFPKPQQTYLGLCRYPYNRFEEICSRLLCFYFNPSNEHGFHDLFLESLLGIIAQKKNICYRNNKIKVETEVGTDEQKRLDILIHSPDITIGIENKIDASVYNPLDIYSKLIEEYQAKNVFKVILSVKKITNEDEIKKIANNGFIIVSYSKLFEKIKQKVGKYISQANQKYLIFMYDFIQTIENMTGESFDSKRFQFFSDNAEKIEELSEQYREYTQRVLTTQQERVRELIQKIKLTTSDEKWYLWEGWDLVYSAFNTDTSKPKIGIESSYKTFDNNPLGWFRICITTWNLADFTPYKNRLTELFPNIQVEEDDGRPFLWVEVINDDNEILIIEKLKYYYGLLYEIVKE